MINYKTEQKTNNNDYDQVDRLTLIPEACQSRTYGKYKKQGRKKTKREHKPFRLVGKYIGRRGKETLRNFIPEAEPHARVKEKIRDASCQQRKE
jgi:hypothetical protein